MWKQNALLLLAIECCVCSFSIYPSIYLSHISRLHSAVVHSDNGKMSKYPFVVVVFIFCCWCSSAISVTLITKSRVKMHFHFVSFRFDLPFLLLVLSVLFPAANAWYCKHAVYKQKRIYRVFELAKCTIFDMCLEWIALGNL